MLIISKGWLANTVGLAGWHARGSQDYATAIDFQRGHPEGMRAISRLLRSEATIPPADLSAKLATLEGSQRNSAANPSGSMDFFANGFRRYRCAQPPANGCDPCGVFGLTS